MFWVLFAACGVVVEEYPDAWTSAADACEESEEACIAHVASDIGDDELVTAAAATLLIREGLMESYDMVAHNVDHVVYGSGDAAAEYDESTRTVYVHETYGVDLYDVAILVHEAGHGRPSAARDHKVCKAGPYAGQKLCDHDLDGAHGAALEVLKRLEEYEESQWLLLDTLDRIE